MTGIFPRRPFLRHGKYGKYDREIGTGRISGNLPLTWKQRRQIQARNSVAGFNLLLTGSTSKPRISSANAPNNGSVLSGAKTARQGAEEPLKETLISPSWNVFRVPSARRNSFSAVGTTPIDLRSDSGTNGYDAPVSTKPSSSADLPGSASDEIANLTLKVPMREVYQMGADIPGNAGHGIQLSPSRGEEGSGDSGLKSPLMGECGFKGEARRYRGKVMNEEWAERDSGRRGDQGGIAEETWLQRPSVFPLPLRPRHLLLRNLESAGVRCPLFLRLIPVRSPKGRSAIPTI